MGESTANDSYALAWQTGRALLFLEGPGLMPTQTLFVVVLYVYEDYLTLFVRIRRPADKERIGFERARCLALLEACSA